MGLTHLNLEMEKSTVSIVFVALCEKIFVDSGHAHLNVKLDMLHFSGITFFADL